MFLRNEIDDRLIITMPDWRLGNLFTVTIDQITDSGLFPVKERTFRSKEIAERVHNATVRKIGMEGKVNPNCSCGRQARQFSSIANAWLCEFCWDIEVGENR